MAKIMWCLKHEQTRLMYEDPDYHFHIDWDYENNDICGGPFYASAPPEDLQGNWQDNLVEPSDEEMIEMDAGAEILLWDLGLADK